MRPRPARPCPAIHGPRHLAALALGVLAFCAAALAAPSGGAAFIGGSATISGSTQSGADSDSVLVPGTVSPALITCIGESSSDEVTASAFIDGTVTESLNGTIVVLLNAFAEVQQPVGSNGSATITAATVDAQLNVDPIIFELCEPLALQFEKNSGLGTWLIELTPITGGILEGDVVHFLPGTYELNVSTTATIGPGETAAASMLFFCVTLVPVQGQCPGDIVPDDFSGDSPVIGDGIVGPGDLAALLASWGPCPPCGPCGADIFPPGDESTQPGDEVVNAADLGEILAHWGVCPQ